MYPCWKCVCVSLREGPCVILAPVPHCVRRAQLSLRSSHPDPALRVSIPRPPPIFPSPHGPHCHIHQPLIQHRHRPLVLQVYPNSTALVVSTENITQNWYFGNERSMLIPNCLFRLGGAAIVLSNK